MAETQGGKEVVRHFAKGVSTLAQAGVQGLDKRTRPIAVQSAFGGKTCDSGEQVQSCNVDACPVDCVVGAWTTFSKCSVSCGPTGGIKTRTRTNVAAQMGGVACPT